MLYDPLRHHVISQLEWNETSARQFIANLFNSTEAALQAYRLTHDEGQTPELGKVAASLDELHLYGGLTGVIWSHKVFEQRGYGCISAKANSGYLSIVQRAKEQQLDELKKTLDLDNAEEYRVGLLIAELGFVITELKLSPSESRLADLHQLVSENTVNTICEYMWGTPGLIATSMAFIDGLSELTPSVKRAVTALEQQLGIFPELQVQAWEQNLYGHKVSHLGAIHGFAGNAFSIIQAFPLMTQFEQKKWSDLIRNTMKLTTVREGRGANWPQSIGGQRPGRDAMLVQFCHGAPGIVSCLTSLMYQGDSEFDELMLAAGELIWQAGPLAKGANLCHGTAGNGFAFLKLFEATQDALWLCRAKHFAMVAMQQVELAKRQSNDYHYSLWAGDIGVAHFVNACINADADIPTMDFF